MSPGAVRFGEAEVAAAPGSAAAAVAATSGPHDPFFERLPIPGFILDAEFRVSSVNDAFERALGHARHDVAGRNFAVFHRREELPRLVETLGRLRRGGADEFEDDWTMVCAGGAALNARVRMRPVEIDGACYIVGLVLQLRERGDARYGLFERDELFRALFVDATLPMTIQDSAYRVVEVNPAYCEWIGIARDAILGRDPIEWMPRDQHEAVWRRRRDAPLRAGAHGTVRRVMLSADGRARHVRLHYCEVFDHERRPYALVSVTDLSEEAELQQRLEAQIKGMDRFFELAPVAFVIRDAQLRIRRVNRAFCTMSGYGEQDVVGRADTMLPRGDAASLDALDRSWQAAQRTPGVLGRARVPLLTRDDRRLLTDRLSTVIEDAAGEHVMLTAVTDITQQHALEEELRRLVLQQGALLRTMSSGVMMVVRDRVIRCNASLERLIGLPAERIIGRGVGEVLSADRSWESILAECREMIDADPAASYEIELRRDDQDPIVCALQLRRVDPASPDTGLIVTLHDITELKRQQARLLQANAELAALVENSAVAIAYLDGERFVRANGLMESMLGFDAGELAGRALGDFVSPGDLGGAELLDVLGSAVRVPRTLAVRLRREDGTRVACLVHHGPIDPQRWPHASILVGIDMSGQEAALSALADSQERFGRFAEAVDEAVFVIDAEQRRALYANTRFERVFGVRADEFHRDPDAAWRHVDDADRALLDELLAHALEPGQHEADVRVARPDGARLTVRLRLFPARAGSAELYGLAEDVTEYRSLAQQRIDEAIQQRDTLVREVHHRIKNNLQGVAGLLQQSAARRPEISAQLEEIVGQIQAIAQVHGLQVREKGDLSFARIARAVFENLARGFGHPIRSSADDFASLECWSVPEQEAVPLALVVNELGTNAIKHCGGDRRDDGVSVDLTMDGEALVLRIRNPGELPPGFALERLAPSPSGLGLIRALLPRRGTRLSLSQDGEQVLTELRIGAPVIRRAAAG